MGLFSSTQIIHYQNKYINLFAIQKSIKNLLFTLQNQINFQQLSIIQINQSQMGQNQQSKQQTLSNTSLIAFGKSKWNNEPNQWNPNYPKFDFNKGEVYENLPMGVLIKYPLIESDNQTSSNLTTRDTPKHVLKFLKELSYTSQQDYQQSYIKNLQKMSQRHQSIMALQDVKTRAQNSFCSTFYKIGLTFQYFEHSLKQQIQLRITEDRGFQERQIWGVLCACIFAMAHMQRYEGRCHCALMLEDIKLTFDGGVKILSVQMVGLQNWNRAQSSSLAILASTITQLLNFVNMNFLGFEKNSRKNNINSQSQKVQTSYNLEIVLDSQKIMSKISTFDCSDQMKQIIYFMLQQNTTVIDVEQKMRKLSQQEEYSNPHSHMSSAQSKGNSQINTPTILKNSQNVNMAGQPNKFRMKPLSAQSSKSPNDQNYYGQNNTPKIKISQYMPPIVQQNKESSESSRYECPRIVKNERDSQIVDNKHQRVSETLALDIPDQPTAKFINDSTMQIQTPDQNDEEDEQASDQRQENQKIMMKQSVKSQNEQSDYRNLQQFTYITGATGKNVHSFNNTNNFNQTQNISLRRPQTTQQNQNILNNRAEDQKQISSYKNKQEIFSRILPPFKNSQNTLFTDPSLLNQIKTDLEQIKMRKSMHNSKRLNMSNVSNSNSALQSSRKLKQQNLNKEHNITKQSIVFQYQHKNSTANLNLNQQQPSCEFQIAEKMMIKESNRQYEKSKQMTQRKQLQNSKRVLSLDKRQSESIIINNQQQKMLHKANNTNTQFKSIFEDNSTGFKKKGKNTARNQQVDNEKESLENRQRISANPSATSLNHYLQNAVSEKSLSSKADQSFNNHSRSLSNQNNQNLEYSRQNYAKGRYQGTKLNGMRHGHGTFYYGEGGKYVGQWSQNRMHGQGVLYYPNNQIAYEGKWQKDQLNGKGILYNEQVMPLNNPYNYQDWSNAQQFWVKYVGDFLRDNKHGNGTLFLSNGEKFEGQFKNDQVDGNGVLFRKDGRQIRGLWRKNKLIRLV